MALNGAEKAIALTIQLGAGYLFFCGLTTLMKGIGLAAQINRIVKPLLKKLMPHMGKAAEAVSLNLSLNMLGLGNAATPVGMQAVELLDEEYGKVSSVRHDLYMFLILNTTGLQLFPTTVLTLRTAAGSVQPNAIIVPTLICTSVSTFVGIMLGMWCRRREERNIGR